MKKYCLILFVILALFLTGCENISEETIKDLAENVDVGIVCNDPYIRHGAECCLDQNSNNICDTDENLITEQEAEEKKEEAIAEGIISEEVEEEIEDEVEEEIEEEVEEEIEDESDEEKEEAIDLEFVSKTKITDFSDYVRWAYPTLSPNGEKVLYRSYDNEVSKDGWILEMIDTDGSLDATKLFTTNAEGSFYTLYDHGLAFDSNTEYAYFTVNRYGDAEESRPNEINLARVKLSDLSFTPIDLDVPGFDVANVINFVLAGNHAYVLVGTWEDVDRFTSPLVGADRNPDGMAFIKLDLSDLSQEVIYQSTEETSRDYPSAFGSLYYNEEANELYYKGVEDYGYVENLGNVFTHSYFTLDLDDYSVDIFPEELDAYGLEAVDENSLILSEGSTLFSYDLETKEINTIGSYSGMPRNRGAVNGLVYIGCDQGQMYCTSGLEVSDFEGNKKRLIEEDYEEPILAWPSQSQFFAGQLISDDGKTVLMQKFDKYSGTMDYFVVNLE